MNTKVLKSLHSLYLLGVSVLRLIIVHSIYRRGSRIFFKKGEGVKGKFVGMKYIIVSNHGLEFTRVGENCT